MTIESATLQLYPVKGTYDGMYPLPKSLALYTANNENVTQSVITDLTGSSVQSGNLVVDEMSYEETYYSFDITSFPAKQNLGKLPDMIVRNYNYFFRTTVLYHTSRRYFRRRRTYRQ